MLPKKGVGDEILAGYTYFTRTFLPHEVVRMRALSMRDPYLSGYGPLQAMYEQVGLGNLYFSTLEDIIGNGAQLGLLATPSNPLQPPSEVDRKRFQADINNHLARGNKAKFLATNGAYKFDQFTMDGTDLADLEISKEARLYVANAFDIPPSMLQNEDSNRAVAEAGNYQHQRNAIEPRCVMIASALTAMAQQVDKRLFFAFDNPVEDDKERTAKIVDLQLKNGQKTINQVNADEGDDPVPWGDEPWLPDTLIQPTAAAQAREHAQGLAEQAAEKPEPDGDEEPDPKPASQEDEQGDRAFWKTFFAARDALDGGADDRTQRELFERLSRALDKIEASADATAPQARPGHSIPPADLDPAQPAEAEPGGAGRRAGAEEAGGEAEHVQPPGWEADREEAEGVVPQAGEGSPGEPADDRDGAADALPAAGELRQPDGGGDDADPRGVLGGERQEDDGQAGA